MARSITFAIALLLLLVFVSAQDWSIQSVSEAAAATFPNGHQGWRGYKLDEFDVNGVTRLAAATGARISGGPTSDGMMALRI